MLLFVMFAYVAARSAGKEISKEEDAKPHCTFFTM